MYMRASEKAQEREKGGLQMVRDSRIIAFCRWDIARDDSAAKKISTRVYAGERATSVPVGRLAMARVRVLYEVYIRV